MVCSVNLCQGGMDNITISLYAACVVACMQVEDTQQAHDVVEGC